MADHGHVTQGIVVAVRGNEVTNGSLPTTASTIDQHVSETRAQWQEIVAYIEKVALALDYAHELGQIHGSIQSSHILVPEDGNGIVCEFRHEAEIPLSAYTAPEQLTKDVADARQTELYRLGVVFYKLLTGREPFRTSNMNMLREQILQDDPQPPRQLAHGLPKDLDSICLRLLAKSPGDRASSGKQVANELLQVLRDFDERVESRSSARASSLQGRCDLAIIYFEADSGLHGNFHDDSDTRSAELTSEINRLLEVAKSESFSWDGDELLVRLVDTESQDDAIERVVSIGAGLLELAYREVQKSGICYQVRVESAELAVDENNESVSRCRSAELIRRVPRVVGEIRRGQVHVDHESWRTLSRWLEHSEVSGDKAALMFQPDKLLQDEWLPVHIQPPKALGDLAGPVSPLAIVKARWEQAKEALGQMVLIIGEEGSGKTRLVDEVVRFVGDSDESKVVIWNCIPGRQELNFHPLSRSVGQMIIPRETENGHEDDTAAVDPADEFDLVKQFLDGIGVSSSETEEQLSRVLELDDVSKRESSGAFASTHKTAVHELIFKWLGHATNQSPVLFVVEDLQWSDPATLDLISRLASDRLYERLLLIATFRPEFETLWGSRAHQTQVALRRLSKKHVQKMIQSRIAEELIDGRIVEQTIHATGGIPLYINAYLDRIS